MIFQCIVRLETMFALPLADAGVAPYVSPTTGRATYDFKLLANGADVAFFDVEVVDARGNRCPTDQARVDFELTGPAVWRGGGNEFKPGTTNNTYLDTECGVNRVFVRFTLEPGRIALAATRSGPGGATAGTDARPITIINGLPVGK